MKLEKSIAIVTGGAGCIGSAIVEKLAEEGALVVVFDFAEEAMEQQKQDMAKRGFEIEPMVVDLCDYDQVEGAVGKVIEKFDKVDILVNNAGYSARKEIRPFAEQKLDVVRRVIDLNLFGTLHCIRAVLPNMIESNSGKIVNITSIVATGGVRGCSDYAAAKAGVLSATKVLALETAGKNININCVSPGKVPRPGETPADEEAFAKRFTLMNRMCTGRDVAELAVFLATDAADYITGQNFIVDGGRSLGLKGDFPGDYPAN